MDSKAADQKSPECTWPDERPEKISKECLKHLFSKEWEKKINGTGSAVYYRYNDR